MIELPQVKLLNLMLLKIPQLTLLFSGLLLLTSCSIHRVDIQQGNVITPEALEKLKLGMNSQQVKAAVGAPLIVDPFKNNRWDYVYRMNLGNIGVVQASHIVLYFENDILAKVDVIKPPISEHELIKPYLNRTGQSKKQGQGGQHSH